MLAKFLQDNSTHIFKLPKAAFFPKGLTMTLLFAFGFHLSGVYCQTSSQISDTVQISAGSVNVSCAQTVDVPIKVSAFKNILSMQGSVQWDTAALTLQSISNFGPAEMNLAASNFGLGTGGGRLPFSWNDPSLKGVTLNDSTSVFVLRFSIDPSARQTSVSISNNPVPLEFVNTSLTFLAVKPLSGVMEVKQTADTSLSVTGSLSFCKGQDSVVLKAAPNARYQWFYNDVAVVGATTSQYVPVTTGKYRVLVTGDKGCSDSSRSVLVNVKARPRASFLKVYLLCSYQVFFENTSDTARETSKYFWDFGNGSTSTKFSSANEYLAPGFYAVKLKVTTASGCTDSTQESIALEVVPRAEFSISKDTQCLTNNSFRFTNTSFGENFKSNWKFGDSKGLSTERSPSYTYVDTGVFRVLLQVESARGCVDSVTRFVRVAPVPSGILETADSLLCEGSIVVLKASGGATYRWYRNGELIAGSSRDSLQARLEGKYTVEVVNSAGCVATVARSITLSLIRKLKLDFGITGACVDAEVLFTNRTDTGKLGRTFWTWRTGDGGIRNSYSSLNVYKTQGDYQVSLTYQGETCPLHKDSLSKVIRIFNDSSVRYRNVVAIKNEPTLLDSRDGGFEYAWTPSRGLSSSTIEKPTTKLDAEQEYLVRILTGNRCLVVDTLLVKVASKADIHVPKAFSPNNDGQNDKLFPIAVGIRELKYFRVYNRWGNLMYESKELSASVGWDGTFKGAKQPMETFVWIAEGIDITGQVIKRGGNTLLIR